MSKVPKSLFPKEAEQFKKSDLRIHMHAGSMPKGGLSASAEEESQPRKYFMNTVLQIVASFCVS